jgi:hypothetical protein
MAFDVIGDIHGQAGKLRALLARLGYQERGGAYRHPDRQAIFVGDFIDRGPSQLESVMTVRRMVDAGSALAVMGNHEFNAIAWHTPDPERPGETLRPRRGPWGDSNRRQHAAFLAEVEDRPLLHAELIDWFLTLPLWLDLPGLRVVHACWHSDYIAVLRPKLDAACRLSRDLVMAASREGWREYTTVEGLTKGLEVELPDGHSFIDKDGISRRRVRIRWWDTSASTYRELALLGDELRNRLPDVPVSPALLGVDGSAKPVFFGHYWMTGRPTVLSPTAACVDYSAGKGGPLVAYRWDGEPVLNASNFVCSE